MNMYRHAYTFTKIMPLSTLCWAPPAGLPYLKVAFAWVSPLDLLAQVPPRDRVSGPIHEGTAPMDPLQLAGLGMHPPSPLDTAGHQLAGSRQRNPLAMQAGTQGGGKEGEKMEGAVKGYCNARAIQILGLLQCQTDEAWIS